MFEKEAEKIAERKISNFIPQQWGVSLIRTEPTWETVEGAPHFYLNSLAKMWQDGAEFGYNKANEWHYVKDGDLPKPTTPVLVILESGVPYVSWISSDKGWWFCTNYYTGEDKVIAWKEIVLPAPKESE